MTRFEYRRMKSFPLHKFFASLFGGSPGSTKTFADPVRSSASSTVQVEDADSHHKTLRVKKPVFIVGCGRSGTGMLFDLLAQHPRLARTMGYPSGEDHDGWIEHGQCFMSGIGESVTSEKFGSGINGYHTCMHMTAEDVTPELVDSMHAHYMNNVLDGDLNKRVLNKCPHNSNKIDYMLGIFPDAKIIHIIRDCEPMVASWIAVMQGLPGLQLYLPQEELPCFWVLPKPDSQVAKKCISRHDRFFPGGGAKMFIDYWVKTNMGIEKQMQNRFAQLLVVRYEDIVKTPVQLLNKITKFCELEHFDYAVSHIDAATALKHKHLLPGDLLEEIKKHASPVRKYFGYLDH